LNRRSVGLPAGLAATVVIVAAVIPLIPARAPEAPTRMLALPVIITAIALGSLVALGSMRLVTAERRTIELETANAKLAELAEDRVRLEEEAHRLRVLEQVDVQRSALLRSVSHDLRTPLATIRAVTSDLQDGPDYDVATRRELLALVGDEAERLDRLVANLLSLSRIEAGAFAPERQAVDLDELLRDRARRLASMFSAASVRLVVDVDDDLPLVDGDYTQLEQVVTNLLENAARHAPLRSTVTVSARHRTRFSAVEVTIVDEGIGVSDYESERVFDAFRRGEGSRSSGIGLAICKAVVEAHGGTIEVRRTEGGGATFAFLLPARTT
jgi:two-component system sensor histidine kinase KdpD